MPCRVELVYLLTYTGRVDVRMTRSMQSMFRGSAIGIIIVNAERANRLLVHYEQTNRQKLAALAPIIMFLRL